MSPPLNPPRLAMAGAMAITMTACSMVTSALAPQVPTPPTIDDLPPNPTVAELRAAGRRLLDWADEHCRDLPSGPERPRTRLSTACEETIAQAGMLGVQVVTAVTAAKLDALIGRARPDELAHPTGMGFRHRHH